MTTCRSRKSWQFTAVENDAEPPGLGERLFSIHIKVYYGVMTRTNIELDDGLVATVMERYHLPSKRSAVDFALRQLLVVPMSRDEVLAMRGSGTELTNSEIEGDWRMDG